MTPEDYSPIHFWNTKPDKPGLYQASFHLAVIERAHDGNTRTPLFFDGTDWRHWNANGVKHWQQNLYWFGLNRDVSEREKETDMKYRIAALESGTGKVHLWKRGDKKTYVLADWVSLCSFGGWGQGVDNLAIVTKPAATCLHCLRLAK